MKDNRGADCSICGCPKSFVRHCKECCGWGATEGVKYHKFTTRRKKSKRRAEAK